MHTTNRIAAALALTALLAACGEDDEAARKARREVGEAVDAAKEYARTRTDDARARLKARLDAVSARMDALRARMKLRMAEGDAEAKVKLEKALADVEAKYAALKDVYAKSEARSDAKSALEEIAGGFERAAKELEEGIDRATD